MLLYRANVLGSRPCFAAMIVCLQEERGGLNAATFEDQAAVVPLLVGVHRVVRLFDRRYQYKGSNAYGPARRSVLARLPRNAIIFRDEAPSRDCVRTAAMK